MEWNYQLSDEHRRWSLRLIYSILAEAIKPSVS